MRGVTGGSAPGGKQSRQHPALGGKSHRAGGEPAQLASAPLPERDVHRPVRPAVLAELPGPVQRIDDPYPLRGQPRLIVDALLGQHGIAGATGSQFGGQELV